MAARCMRTPQAGRRLLHQGLRMPMPGMPRPFAGILTPPAGIRVPASSALRQSGRARRRLRGVTRQAGYSLAAGGAWFATMSLKRMGSSP